MSWNPQHSGYSQAVLAHEPNEVPDQGDPLLVNSKRLQDELVRCGTKIKEHENNLQVLKFQQSQLDASIVDEQVRLRNWRSSSTVDESPHYQCHKDTLEQIMKYDKSAAGILCQLLAHPDFQNSSNIFTKDVIGVVATLGQVEDDALSRLLSEYLGLDDMLAIVCKSFDGVKGLEVYNYQGHVNQQSGIHGLGASIGRPVQGRFNVICLENIIPYGGGFIAGDPQRSLNLIIPKMPNGEIPAGFLGYAVNMIKASTEHLYNVTASGWGIRETLFYDLFSRLQVYSTREEMLNALPLISDGAISLDGGFVRNKAKLSLGCSEDIGLQFPKPPKLDVPREYLEMEINLKKLERERDGYRNDIRREQSLLNQAKCDFQHKKQEFVRFLTDQTYINQHQMNRYPQG